MMNKQRLISVLFALFICNLGFAQSIEWLTKPKYDAISPFQDGVASVCEKGKWGYISQQGDVIVKPEYEKVYDFSEGIGVITSLDGQLKGIANQSGVIQVPYGLKVDPRFSQFSDGLLLVTDGKKWGYLNKSGSLQIQCKFTSAHPFSEGLAAVTASSYGIGGWAYINPSGIGVILQDNNFTWASSFYQGKAIVAFSKQLACIDARGKRVDGGLPKLSSTMERYDTFKGELSCKEGTATFDGQGRLATLETPTGKQTFQNSDIKVENSLVQVKKERGKSGFIINGKETPCQFEDIFWFDNTTAIVIKGINIGVVSLNEEKPISVTLKESTLSSENRKPALATLVVKNLQSSDINNINLTFSDGTLQTIDKLKPNESKDLGFSVPKNTEVPSEEKELEIGVELDGLTQNPIKQKVTINDKAFLHVEFPQESFEGKSGEPILVSFKITNESDITAENVAIQVSDQSKIIYKGTKTIQKEGTSVCQFNISAVQSQTKELEIEIKPSKTRPIKISKEISLSVKKTDRSSETPPPGVIHVLENKN
ncbi:MAG: WG repeat-containing protein [Prolixibacteraceae bacterium]